MRCFGINWLDPEEDFPPEYEQLSSIEGEIYNHAIFGETDKPEREIIVYSHQY